MTLIPKTALRRRGGYLACAALSLTAAFLVTGGSGGASAATSSEQDGIVCEAPTTSTNTSETFTLDATDGYVSMPDGNSIYMWSYTIDGHGFQFPGPTLCVKTNDTVTVILHNHLREDTSVLFSGQDGVTADGLPVQPQFTTSGSSSLMTSLVQVAPAATSTTDTNGNTVVTPGTVTYSFKAGSPGTYLYSSGTDVRKQHDMGLYGALIVRPSSEPTAGLAHDMADSTGAGTGVGYDPKHEYLHLLSQIDPDLHSAVEMNKAYNYTASVPRYFLINGRSMPDTLAPNHAAWLPSQPYGALLHIQPKGSIDPATGKEIPPALLRYLDAGETNYPFHPHGSSQRVIVRDGSPVQDANSADASYMKFLVDVGPGQSVDTIVSWSEEYNTTDKQIPSDIQLPAIQDQVVGPGTETWFSENPYLGGTINPIPNGMTQNNQCGEYYQIAHSHALQQSTNYGASFGGMMTLIRIDPANNYNCGQP